MYTTYIPTPVPGHMWITSLLVVILFTLLIAFWVRLIKDILDWGAEKVNVSLLIVTTLVIIFFGVMLLL